MNTQTNEEEPAIASDWPLRPLLLAVLGGAAALAIRQLLTGTSAPPSLDRLAITVAIGTGAIGFGFVAEKLRLAWAVAFSIIIGALAGFIVYWQGLPGGSRDFWDWRLTSLFLAIAIAAPLFQTARDEGRWHLPYPAAYGHALTNVVLWFASWSFVAVVWLMSWLLAALFKLIKIDFLEKLLGKDWFVALLLGSALGAAIGLFRERDRILRLLQTVVTSVLSVLAPVLGVGLLLFLIALPFAGIDALWDATRATTPILLTCVLAALILANAVIGTGEHISRSNRLLDYGAMALAVVMLPLAAIAAVATGLRIDQHGFTPDRLWALTFVIFATAFGVAYLVSLARHRLGWAVLARAANLRLVIAIGAVALFLATPIISFNAISTADQVARLTSGRVKPDKFDWAALAFDFGTPGQTALRRLAQSKDGEIARQAKIAMTKTNRYDLAPSPAPAEVLESGAKRLRILPRPVPLPFDLRRLLVEWNACGNLPEEKCTLLFIASGQEAIAFRNQCFEQLATAPAPVVASPACPIARFRSDGREWRIATGGGVAMTATERAQLKQGLASGSVEVRTVPRRQMYIGGVPVGEPFE